MRRLCLRRSSLFVRQSAVLQLYEVIHVPDHRSFYLQKAQRSLLAQYYDASLFDGYPFFMRSLRLHFPLLTSSVSLQSALIIM